RRRGRRRARGDVAREGERLRAVVSRRRLGASLVRREKYRGGERDHRAGPRVRAPHVRNDSARSRAAVHRIDRLRLLRVFDPCSFGTFAESCVRSIEKESASDDAPLGSQPMEIFLDKRAVRQIRLSAQDAIEEGDTETLREDILEAFTEEQVEEIERRLDNG